MKRVLYLGLCLAWAGCTESVAPVPADGGSAGADVGAVVGDGGACAPGRACGAGCCAENQSCVAGTCVASQCSPPCAGETPECFVDVCRCTATSCPAGRQCVNGACVEARCSPECGGETPECVAGTCRCNATSCGPEKSCAGGACVPNRCTPACGGETPDCFIEVCRCNSTSCGSGRSCVSGGCVATSCTPPCSGARPDCVGGACRCNANSCAVGESCDATTGACVEAECSPACSGETPECAAGRCRCTTTSCGVGKTCDAAGTCQPVTCAPACGGETPECVAGVCRCSATSCGTGKVCGDGACVPDALCSPANPASCPGTLACRATGPDDTEFRCRPPGAQGDRAECASSMDCARGLACLEVEEGRLVCLPVCDPAGSTCAGPCVAAHGAGVCLRQECSQDTQDCASPQESCYEDRTGTRCLPTGTVAIGQPCGGWADCVRGGVCWDGTCRTFCRSNCPVTTDECVIDYFTSNASGACVPNCGDLGEPCCSGSGCNAGLSCVTGTCQRVSCNPLSPVACASGESCSDTGELLPNPFACSEAGSGLRYAPCLSSQECQAGLDCIMWPTGTSHCTEFCDASLASSTCSGGEPCTSLELDAPAIGGCLPCPMANVCTPAVCCPGYKVCQAGACVAPVCGVGSTLTPVVSGASGVESYFSVRAEIVVSPDFDTVSLWLSGGGRNPAVTTIEGDQLNTRTCTVCVSLKDNYGRTYVATGGTVELTSVSGRLTGTLTGISFQESTIDNKLRSHPVAGGCATQLGPLSFDLALQAE